jgi:2-methylcitrate dehydratase
MVHLKGGRVLEKEKRDYEGFFTRPMGWDRAVEKFNRLSARYVNKALGREIVDSVAQMEDINVTDLTSLLHRIPDPKRGEKA